MLMYQKCKETFSVFEYNKKKNNNDAKYSYLECKPVCTYRSVYGFNILVLNIN